ncbi:hypothetical protein C8R46DRAFT_1092133 [Mycena filopes]|nr:hypothetical protein C8R46DRAFT_1092133 [Mycena filopes]
MSTSPHNNTRARALHIITPAPPCIITPATPPRFGTHEREIHDLYMDGVHTPPSMSDYGSPEGSAYSPSFSDTSEYDLWLSGFPRHRYGEPPVSPPTSYYDSSPTAHMNSGNLPSDARNRLSPVLPLLSLPDCGPRLDEYGDQSPTMSSPEDSALFAHFQFGPVPYPQTLVINNGLLMAPPQHGFTSARARHEDGFDSLYQFESGASTPNTSSSSFPSSPFSDDATSPRLAPATPDRLHRRVSSAAGLSASTRRRKRAARFSCDICRDTFTAKHNLLNHENAHRGIKNYACVAAEEGCPGTFTTRAVKKRHEKKCKFLRPPETFV